MLNKLYASVLFTILLGTAVFAQNPLPAPEKPIEKTIKRMILTTPAEKSYLGVQIQEISSKNLAEFGLREVRGVGISKVIENSPAATAGLLKGDVILEFNGEAVTSVRKLLRLISEVAPEHTAMIKVFRNGTEQNLTAKIGKQNAPAFQNGSFTSENFPIPPISAFPKSENETMMFYGSSRQIGVNTTALTEQLGDYFGIANGTGLLINTVRENSPAAKAGLKAGDIIVEIDGKQVKNNFDLVRAIGEKKEGDVQLIVVREKNRQTFTVTPEESKENFRFKTQEFEEMFKKSAS